MRFCFRTQDYLNNKHAIGVLFFSFFCLITPSTYFLNKHVPHANIIIIVVCECVCVRTAQPFFKFSRVWLIACGSTTPENTPKSQPPAVITSDECESTVSHTTRGVFAEVSDRIRRRKRNGPHARRDTSVQGDWKSVDRTHVDRSLRLHAEHSVKIISKVQPPWSVFTRFSSDR